MSGKISGKKQRKKPFRCSAASNSSPQGHTKGKILRLKQGYNPNSSSLGSVVFALPAALFGVTISFGLASSIITSAFLKKGKQDIPKKKPDDVEILERLMEGEEIEP